MGKEPQLPGRQFQLLLFIAVFVIATCGLIYELIAGTLASYLLGDSVTQFSMIIGIYLFSMGIGSWLSKFIDGNLVRWFIYIEIMVGLIGGCSAAALFLLFQYVISFRTILYTVVGLTGMLVGLEIPILMRILKDDLSFKDLVSRVFTFDYIGALLASLIFPLVLVPYFGLIRSAAFFGLLNVLIAWILLLWFDETKRYRRSFSVYIALTSAVLISVFAFAEKIMSFSETASFQDNVIFSKSTPYQRIVLTRNSRELRLFLNGNLQFSSADEYRYHEALIHPAMQALPHASKILVLGGGDGLAIRELLKYPQVRTIQLVDLDPAMTQLFSSNDLLLQLNKDAFHSPKVKVINADAFNFIRQCKDQYDLIVIDFPDPSNFSIGKLYSQTFYTELYRILKPDGLAVIQSTSPFVARRSFWCITHTVEASGFFTIPYHVYVPSFGEWGYVLASKTHNWRCDGKLPSGVRFVNNTTIRNMLYFPPDMAELPTDVNKLNNQVLVHYFEEEWAPYMH